MDLDTMGHLNNVGTMVLLESARLEYLAHLGLTDVTMPNIVVASLSCDYLSPAHFCDNLTVGVRTVRLGRTSLDLEYVVFREDQVPVARAHTVLVHVDPGTTRPQPLTPGFRNSIQGFEGGSVEEQ